MQYKKHFTLEQATAMLPTLRLLFYHIKEITRPTIPDELAPGPDSLLPTAQDDDLAARAAAEPILPLNASVEDRRAAIEKIHRSILMQGIVIQDVKRGLIDFPAVLEGREVFLCYELEDGDQITHYHEIEAGFAGRKPLKGPQ